MAGIPEDFLICPITGVRLVDPVVDPEGNTYERAAIMEWLSRCGESPLTRTPLAPWQLVPNRTLADLLHAADGSQTSTVPSVTHSSTHEDTPAPPFELKLDVTHDGANVAAVHLEAASDSVSRSHAGRTIVCVLDISYSMDDRATMHGDEEGAAGLSLLDIVKHATRTVIDTLEPHDRLGVVVYSCSASVLYPIQDMTVQNKAAAWNSVRALSTTGQTNLWDGLLSALELCNTASVAHANILLLTDGQPNIGPPRGHVPSLRQYLEKHPDRSVEISTFGFGYNMASRLLHDLAAEGGGCYSFIPDSSFVGTCFVNAVANILATALSSSTLVLESLDGSSLYADFNGLACTPTETGITLRLPAMPYGQPKTILAVLTPPKGALTPPSSARVRAYLKYGNNKRTAAVDSRYCGPGSDGERFLLEQRARLQTVKLIRLSEARIHKNEGSADVLNQNEGSADALASVQQSVEIMLKEVEGSVATGQRSSAFTALLEDVKGQITQAYSRMDWHRRWGRHYLPSLARAHAIQQCTNFKDPGLQAYAGAKFCSVRDFSEAIFLKLPPPTPSLRPFLPVDDLQPLSMELYHNRDNPCFAAGMVLLADGSRKAVDCVVAGEVVATPTGGAATIKCVVVTRCAGGAAHLVTLEDGVAVTMYHPVRRLSGSNPCSRWRFPCALARPALTRCDTVYSFVLEPATAGAMVIGDYACVTLGHGLTEEGAAHPYLGTPLVLSDLAAMEGWADGKVLLSPGPAVRDPTSGLIMRLEQKERLRGVRTRLHSSVVPAHALGGVGVAGA